ncbi:hypothetical protein KP509_02G096200 [Ceratopteris richardii]|uniref:VDE lipocalin domain-containing protein n=1 Tax=Ceratopteris richardii TaxID=49495 RepID=A0A8T2V8V4_CERRI|nr:hypothetical protein KP509_02G096200 [Ceratopteris richardii]
MTITPRSYGGSPTLDLRGVTLFQQSQRVQYIAGSNKRTSLLHSVKSLRVTASFDGAESSASKWTVPALRSLLASFLVGLQLSTASSSEAVDALKTCTCLLKECRVELARCIADPKCAANIACLQTCNNRPDETECQVVET